MHLRLHLRLHLRHTSLLALTLALACGPETGETAGTPTATTESCPAGAEGCPCLDDGDCDDELQCVADVCAAAAGTTAQATTSGGSTSAETTGGLDTTTDTNTTGTTGDDETTGCEFICETDIPNCDAVPGLDGQVRCSLCDVFAQDCPDGQKCTGYDSDGDSAWDTTKCVDVMGSGQHGDACTAEGGASGVDDCAEGVMCWNLDEEGVGTCVELCTGTPENPMCGPPGTTCVITNEGSLNLCLPSCDPLVQDCQGAEVCIGDPNSDGFVCVLDASGGMAPEGTPCEFANVCNPGLMCVNPEFFPSQDCQGSIGCCAPFCDLTDAGACDGLSVANAECVSYYDPEPAPPGLENIGVCGVPQP